MSSSEKLIELGDSWFSPKCLEGQPQVYTGRGRALFELRALPTLLNSGKLRMLSVQDLGVRMAGISSSIERGITQIIS